jgi:hypothetical protein
MAELGARLGYPDLRYAEAFRVRFEGHPRLLRELGSKVPG